MKRSILTLTLILLIFSLVSALDSPLTEIQDNAEKVNEIKETLQDNETRNEFLLKKWSEFTGFDKITAFLDATLPPFNLLFVLFLGIEYSSTWLFWISLLVFFALFILAVRPLNALSGTNPFISSLIVLAVLGLIARENAIPEAVKSLGIIFSSFWTILIIVGIMVFILSFYSRIMKQLGKKMEEKRKKEKEAERETREQGIDKIKEIKIKSGTV